MGKTAGDAIMATGFEKEEISQLWKMGNHAVKEYERTGDEFFRGIIHQIQSELDSRETGMFDLDATGVPPAGMPTAGPTRDTTAKRLKSIEAAEEAAAEAESARYARPGWIRRVVSDPLGDISRASSIMTQPRVLQGAAALAAEMVPLLAGRAAMRSGSPVAPWLVGTAAPLMAGYGGAAGHKLGQWFHPKSPESIGWGKLTPTPWNLFTSGTGAKGAGFTEAKIAAGGQLFGQALGAFGQAGSAKLLGLQQNRMGLWGRRYPPLTPEYQKLVDHYIEQAELAGVRDIMPTAPIVGSTGATITGGIYGALQKLPWIRKKAAKAATRASKKAEEEFLGRLLRLAPDGGSRFELSERMFEAVRNFSHRQIKGYSDLYDAAWDGAERMSKGASDVSMRGVIDTANEILRGTGVRTIKDGVPGTMAADLTEDLVSVVEEFAILRPGVTVRELRDLHTHIRSKLSDLDPGDAGYREFTQLDQAVTSAQDNFISGADGLYGEGATDILRGAFGGADDAFRAFTRLVDTEAGTLLRTAQPHIFQGRYARAFDIKSSRTGAADGTRIQQEAEGAFIGKGSIEIDKLLDKALLLSSPDYVRGLRNIIDDPKTWNEIVRQRLERAALDSIGMPLEGDAALLQLRGFQTDKFAKALGLDEGDEVLEAMLKGTGHSVKQIKAFANVMDLVPRDDTMGQFMLRRTMLMGAKGVTSLSPLALIVSAAAGGAAMGGAGGFLSMSAAVGTLIGMKKFIGVLSRPKMLERFTTYGKSEAAFRGGKLSRNARFAQYATFLHTMAEILSPDDKEERDSFVSRMMDVAVDTLGYFPEHLSPLRYEGSEAPQWNWIMNEDDQPVRWDVIGRKPRLLY